MLTTYGDDNFLFDRILKKLQPIIYKEQVPVYEPPSYGGEYGGY